MTDQERRKFLKSATMATGAAVLTGCGGGGAASSSVVTPVSDSSPVPTPTPTLTAGGGFPFTLPSPSPSSAGRAPFCLGYAFRKGNVPSGQTLVSNISSLQVTPKNRWPDGSLKFAVIAGLASLTANTPLTATLSAGSPVDRKSTRLNSSHSQISSA